MDKHQEANHVSNNPPSCLAASANIMDLTEEQGSSIDQVISYNEVITLRSAT